MSYPLVRELAAEAIPVRLTCGVLGFSTQAFYKWRKRLCCVGGSRGALSDRWWLRRVQTALRSSSTAAATITFG